MELTPIDFLAQMINDQKARSQGYTAPARWLTLREDLKAEYKAEAERIFEGWKEDELNAKKNRDELDSKIRYKEI